MRRALSLSAVILLLWVGLALAATQVYYSVCPFGTGNLLSGGSPTIEVDSSGNATLTLGGATFADNIGQGVCVEYNGIVSFIDSITDSTHFHLVTALGVSASSQTSTAVTSIHHVFASLADGVAGSSGASLLNGSDLTSLDVLLNLACYYDHDDYTPDTYVILDGYVTDEGRYVRVYTPRGLAYGESVYSQRSEDGIWDDNLYRISFGGLSPIRPRDPYLVFDGLQIETAGDYHVIFATSWYFADGVSLTFKNLILRSSAASATGEFGLYLGASHSINYYVENCIIYGFSQDSGCGGIYVGGGSGSTASIYNSVICGNSIGVNRAAGTVSVVNCAVFNNTDDFNGTITATYTASDDNDISGTGNVDISPGATEADDWAAAFTDYTNGDFSLKSGSPLIDAGIGPALDSNVPTTDIVGTPRSGNTCDIGAFEYVVSGGNGSKWNGITPAKWNGIDWSNLKWNGM